MRSICLAAFFYTSGVFAVGFVLGAFRVIFLAPRVGEMPAVAIELPLMLIASYFIAKAVLHHWHVPRHVVPRLSMGALAFAILMVFEVTLSLTLFGNSLEQHLARYGRPVAWLGIAGQLVFAAMPVLLLARARD